MPASLTSFLDFIIRHASTAQARVILYIFSALESIIIPVPVDPYLAACVFARSKDWVRISLFTALASVMGGAIGWYLGFALQDVVAQIAILLPEQIAGEALFSSVSATFQELGLILVLLPFLLLSAIGRTARFLLVGGLVAYRRDVRMVTGLASILVVLICASIYITR